MAPGVSRLEAVGKTIIILYLGLAWLCCGLLGNAVAQPLSPGAVQQIQALLTDKAARTPAQQKISSQLLYAVKMHQGEAIAPGVPALRAGVDMRGDATVLVDITARVSEALRTAIAQAGGQIVHSAVADHRLRVRLPLTRIETVADWPAVQAIRPAIKAMTARSALARRTRVAGVHTAARQEAVNVSAGDVAHQADRARQMFGVDGTGIKIGVLSDSVHFLTQAQRRGELPEVTVLPGQSGTGDPDAVGEGTAMLEIVHDLAPGAQLFFATAFSGPAAFAQNIRHLRFMAGCDIIVDDILYFDEPPFQDGIIARAVNEVTADGALYFAAAGNEGNRRHGTSGVWEGDFVDGGPLALVPGGTVHDFGGGALANHLTDDAPFAITLFWSDPLGGSNNDYDLFILDAAMTRIVAASTDIQNGDDDPFEIIMPETRESACSLSTGESCAARRGERLVVLRHTGAAPRFLHLNTNRGQLAIQTSGQIHGHNSAAEAYSVAAVDVTTARGGAFVGGAANPVEPTSADGPRRIFYDANGNPITPGNLSSTGGMVRHKPDLTAADGVTVTTPGFAPFFGTSAAAPHAAAIAALVKAANPSLTPAHIRTVLTTTALDIEAPGVDDTAGAGIVNALAAVQAARAFRPPPVTCQTCPITAGLIAGTVRTEAGTSTVIPVDIRQAPNAVEALAFDVTFDPAALHFTGFTQGPLTAQWSFFDVSMPEAGRVRVAGATIQHLVAAASDTRVLDLHFEVLACQTDQEFPLAIANQVDNVATWDSCTGCLHCGCPPDGDVNQDRRITPADALLAFQYFLSPTVSLLDACQRSRANVADPDASPITPADALCIFRKFIGVPSCLDE